MSTPSANPPSVGTRFFREDLPLADLQPSPLNPRKHFDDRALAELAASIASVGVIEPLVVRPVNGHYEVVAGERRFRAAQQAGLTSVPSVVKPLTDAQALEIMVIENNQREDVNALEEGDGFSRLLKAGYDLEKLAERLGRSKKYVYDRIKLLDLAPTAQQLLLADKMTAGHAILLARLKPADQTRAIDPDQGGLFSWDSAAADDEDVRLKGKPKQARRQEALAEYNSVKPRSVRELNQWIADHVRFDVDQAVKAAPLEYGETAARVTTAEGKPGKGKKVIPITFDHYVQPEARSDDRTYGPRAFKIADGKEHFDFSSYRSIVTKTCEFSVLGVVAVGEHYGAAFDVCVARDKCEVHWKAEIAERNKSDKRRAAGKPSPQKVRQDSYAAQREQEQRENELRDRKRKAWDAVAPKAFAALAVRLKPMAASGNGRVMAAALDAMSLKVAERELREKLLGKLTPATALLWIVWTDLVGSHGYAFEDFSKAVKGLGVDLKAVETAYQAALTPAQTSAHKTKKKR